MPRFNVDQAKGLVEPIEFTLNGKNYQCKNLTSDVLNQTMDVVEEFEESERARHLEDIHAKQLAIFTGEPEDEFRALDIRQTTAILNFIQGCVTDAREDVAKKAVRSR